MKQKDTFIIAISILITIIAWIGFHIYHASVTSTVPESLQKQIEPIEGKFDVETINAIKKREKVSPISQSATVSATPTPSFRVGLPASPSATGSSKLSL